MIEIDHTTLPAPEPAKPVLASQLLVIEEEQRRRFADWGTKIKSECVEVDEYVLGGGFERGIVVGLSCERSEGRLLSLNLLASVLLSHFFAEPPSSTRTRAIVIDTTGSFPIPLLASIIKSRIISSFDARSRQEITTGNYEVGGEPKIHYGEVDRGLQMCLEMVAISRVFDLEGLWEVLGEVGRDSRVGDEAIAPDLPIQSLAQGLGQDRDDHVLPPDEGTELLIIDNMSHIINELFSRKEKGEAHMLLTTLSRILHALTHTSNILTLLHNGTTSTTPSYQPPNGPPRRPQNQQQTQSLTSIFNGNPVKPALGRIFDQFLDLHLLLSPMPKRREDAELLDGRDESPFQAGAGSGVVEYCTVVEVMKDETPNLEAGKGKKGSFGKREQRWAAVQESGDGLALISAFQEKGNMRGMTMEREKKRGMGLANDVGGVAKIYGFGGRRV